MKPETHNIIKVRDLHKIYSTGEVETKVLRGIDLEIPAGQFVSITGPSGTGKSTLLYQISLLDKPTSGSIYIEDTKLENLTETESTEFRLANFGYVFQDYGLIPELTATENLMVPLLMKGFSRSQAKKEAVEALKSLDLARAVNNLPSQISGGEQQRVSVARAIVGKPKIIFADEPTASLDTKRSREVIDIFLRLHKEGQTIVMVTHEPEFAEMTDRIVDLLDGQVHSDKILRK